MIYSFLFSNSKQKLLGGGADYRTYTIAKNLKEAKDIAYRLMVDYGYNYCVIGLDEINLTLLEKEAEIMKALARWFS